MNEVLRTVLSLSLSGGLLILVLLLGKALWKDRLSCQWQYYIWLVVLARLLLPFGPEAGLLGRACQAAGQALGPEAVLTPQTPLGLPEEEPAAPPESGVGAWEAPKDHTLRDLLAGRLWLVWLAGALGLLVRKMTAYQDLMRYIRAGMTPVSDLGMLDRLSEAAEEAGVKGPVELWVNPMVSSPMLTGFFRPCVVLPSGDLSEEAFRYIALHELTHCRRRDLAYKWLVQVTVCLHWFNPLVHLMSREIARACEFSCDEAVLARAGRGSARAYGQTLLDAMAAAGRYREAPGAVTLSENKRLLKERLGAIMRFKEKTGAVRLLTAVLTVCVTLGAVFAGVHPLAAAAVPREAGPRRPVSQTSVQAKSGGYARLAEKYYEAGSLPLFQMAFARLDEEAQVRWLERIYADGSISFLGAAVAWMEDDSASIQGLAETVYREDSVAFFSALAMHMSDAALEAWLDRALEDGKWAFQSVLFNALDRDEEWDALEEAQEKEWEAAQKEEYAAVGVTVEGKDYYYQGQLVNVFLDIRANKSFYTLNMNPRGTVSVKILRDAGNKIVSAVPMTEAEVRALLEDMEDEDEEEVLPVDIKAVAAGQTVCLGEYVLEAGDEVWYDLTAETGKGMQVFFGRDGERDRVYWSVHNLRRPGEALRCAASGTVTLPAKPGTYRLYLRAADGALERVRGAVPATALEP